MTAVVLRIAIGVVIVYVALVLIIWVSQNKLAFPAPRSHLPAPNTLGFPDGEKIRIITSDSIEIGGWYLPPRDSTRAPHPALIWFYGNMETVDVLAPIYRNLQPENLGLLAINYRGYGDSEGAATEEGLYRDGEAAWRYLAERPDVDSTRIAVYGRSLGSVVALYLATERNVRAVILDSPFSSARDMARVHYRFLPKFLIRLSLDNVERASRIQAPLIVFHGTLDRIAPVRMGRAVAEAGRALELVLIEGAGHNDTYTVGGGEYQAKMHAFLAEHLQ